VEADKNMTALKKCPRCGEGRYCCQAHCNLDWDRHKLLCQDIKLKGSLNTRVNESHPPKSLPYALSLNLCYYSASKVEIEAQY
jgi:hypothetical protein